MWLDVECRSASYPPNSWDYKLLESLGTGNHNQEEGFDVQMKKMKDQVRDMIEERETPALDKLELIDAVQRLGIEYHFESSIKDAVEHVRAQALDGRSTFGDLHSTALMFRLLRHHGIDVQTNVSTSLWKMEGLRKYSGMT
ncbi:hypothetical protein MLD38_007598 [Melastoma candidum]|uniref:Uncharacterized protein n=1 Tax=Melastoma candidum TaxID=119954 RepID=A0ACB9RSZ1_9MYRT|nr:hypothetical protein MLD38_007598 [Melastoma candidum]